MLHVWATVISLGPRQLPEGANRYSHRPDRCLSTILLALDTEFRPRFDANRTRRSTQMRIVTKAIAALAVIGIISCLLLTNTRKSSAQDDNKLPKSIFIQAQAMG